MNVERIRHNGMLVVSELVERPTGTVGPIGEPRQWYETVKYIDYTETEARELFAENLREQGLVPVDA